VQYSLRPNDRSEIAELAAPVDREARGGDAVSRGILEEAADALSESVRDLHANLGIGDAPLPLVGVGGVIAGSALYWTMICERVLAFAPALRPVRVIVPSVFGHDLLAARDIGVPDPVGFRRKLFAADLCHLRKCTAERGDTPSPPLRE
jgi:N-acetylglucosamine kinase-like BadF-type ATPase